ncbi:MAG: RNA polymerase factor sigma-54 [Stomatobaculum sp.]
MNPELILSQKPLVTQQFIQSLSILEMNALQLEAHVQQLAMENPLLNFSDPEENCSAQRQELSRQEELLRKTEWLSSADRQNRVYYEEDAAGSAEDNLQDIAERGESLAEYLHAQLLLKKYSPAETAVSEYLLASLDSRGYITEKPSAVSACLSVPLPLVLRLLSDIRDLDPAGVGARDLKDCLLLQLSRRKTASPLTRALVTEHLEDIAKQHLDLLSRKLKVSAEEIRSACAEIRSLNPKPGNSFSDRRHLSYIHPDILVVKLQNRFEILVNESRCPKISINGYYRALSENPPDPETGKYLRDKLQQAEALRTDLKTRSTTLGAVARILVQRQSAFFQFGPGNRCPMQLRDIADALSLHESTVSRALSNKFLQCSYGIYPLNFFLSPAAAVNPRTGAKRTPDYIKQRLLEIIAAEDKEQPLSDDGIRAALHACGIPLARRTVNKYRHELGIPDRGGRRV